VPFLQCNSCVWVRRFWAIAMETIPVKTMIPSTSLIHNHAFKRKTTTCITSSRRISSSRLLRFSIHSKFSDTNFQGNPTSQFLH